MESGLRSSRRVYSFGCVVVLDEVVDSGDEVYDAAEAAAVDGLLCEETKPPFDLVEPGGVGWRVVDVEARPLRQPQPHFGMLVRGVVVDDQMDVQVFGHSLIDVLEKAEKLLMAVARPTLGEDSPEATSRAAKSVVVPWRT